MPEGLVERYDERIAGVLSCYDRIVITGTLPGVCHARGMTSFVYTNAIRIFDYPQFAATLRDTVRENAAKVAEAAGAERSQHNNRGTITQSSKAAGRIH
jgi:hypothetical protein